MQATGISIKRCIDQDLYHWLIRWFNPKADITEGDLDQLVETLSLPEQGNKPFGYDFSSLVFISVLDMVIASVQKMEIFSV